jgi:GAF domain-containing protein
MDELYRAAAAAAVLGSDERHRALLQSIADVARMLFAAQAATIFLADDTTDELVLAAISGSGESGLIDTRLPAGTGIAGWTLTTRQPLSIMDLASDERFSATAAETYGYVPDAVVSTPILLDDDAVGVLQVLDPGLGRRIGQRDLTLLGLFASQAGIALDIVRHARRANEALTATEGSATSVARLAARVDERKDPDLWARVLDALEEALDGDR